MVDKVNHRFANIHVLEGFLGYHERFRSILKGKVDNRDGYKSKGH